MEREFNFVPLETEAGVVLVRLVDGGAKPSGPRDVADVGYDRLSSVLSSIRQVAHEMVQTVDGLGMSRATVEFGVTFSMHAGKLVAAIVDAGQECAFKLILEWTPKEQPAGGGE
jgi:Trypsin-co-occurring domain 1